MDILVGREEVVHDDEMDLPTTGKLHSVEPVKSADEGMRVVLDVRIILFEDLEQEFMFRVPDGLDNESVVAGEVEERARFAWGSEFGKDVL
jgi:hypothetical protein